MKFTYIKASGYIGFYAKLGLKNIFIDFTKFTHNIILIEGANGCGKSTLMGILHVFPDNSSSLIPNESAYKELGVVDNNIEYKMRITYKLKKNGSRDATKAYLYRKEPNGFADLNPNGNISSYKELIESIFEIDPNYVYLSKISSENRGLVDKTPSERKAFSTSIIESVEVYNNMYKILNKKSSIFKSMVNTISSKIDQLGDEKSLLSTLASLENRISKMTGEKEGLIASIASDKSKISLLDPDGSIQHKFDDIYANIKKTNEDIKTNQLNIDAIKEKVNGDISVDNITNIYTNLKGIVSELETQIKIDQSRINRELQEKEDQANNLQNKSAKLEALQMETNYTSLKSMIKDSEDMINEYQTILDKIGIKNIDNVSKDEFVLGLNSLKEIKDIINTLYLNTDYNIVLQTIISINNNKLPDINDIDNKIINITNNINELNIKHHEYETLLDVSKKLELRPKECHIDNCNFIKDSLDSIKREPEKNLDTLDNQLSINNMKLDSLVEYKKKAQSILETSTYLNSIIRSITINASVINKLPVNINIFSDKESILSAIENKYDFKEIDILYQYIQYANIIEDYKSECSKLAALKQDEKIYIAKNEIADDMIKDIDQIQSKIADMQKEIDEGNKRIIDNTNKVNVFKSTLIQYETLISLFNNDKDLKNKKKEFLSMYDTIRNKMADINTSSNMINKNNNLLIILNNQLNPVIESKEKIKHSIELSKEYNIDLETYRTKYKKVQVLKKYSSPTKEGIQMLFVEIYMNKILTIANELLSLLFDGEYVLEKFIINQNEFRIPCVGSRIRCDDVSSMSTSQKCMIGMIISFAILYQASTKFNIIRLDEIDSGLDEYNRLMFAPIIDKIMSILGSEQCFIISHNQEFDSSNVDVLDINSLSD